MPKKPSAVPRKYLGKWIAWDNEATKIIASGETFAAVRKAATKTAERDPLLENIPRGLVVG